MLEFVSIIETGGGDDSRVSSLAICDADPVGSLRVVGNLPHGYTWQPATARDRASLVTFLQGIEYPDPDTDTDKLAAELVAITRAQNPVAAPQSQSKLWAKSHATFYNNLVPVQRAGIKRPVLRLC